MGRPQIPRNAFLAEDMWLLQGLPFIPRPRVWLTQRVRTSFGPKMGQHCSYIIWNTQAFTVARYLKKKKKKKTFRAPSNLSHSPYPEFPFFLNKIIITYKIPTTFFSCTLFPPLLWITSATNIYYTQTSQFFLFCDSIFHCLNTYYSLSKNELQNW